MLKIESVTWQEPEPHCNPRAGICTEFNGHWESDVGAWCLTIHEEPISVGGHAMSRHTLINYCPFCGADLRCEKPALP